MRIVYTCIFYLLLPFALIRLWRRGAKLPEYRERWSERLGKAPKLDKNKTTLWFHTVSVGEFIAARPLIQHYLDDAQNQILITCTTPTGSERIRAIFGDKVAHCYLPYDIPLLLNRFLSETEPTKFICLETELWPNLIHCCQKRNIPIVLANARLSEKSAKGYARFPSLTQNMLAGLSAAAIQNQEDADRFIALGLAKEKTHSIGNIKFDLELSDALRQQADQLRQVLTANDNEIIWIAASTHKSEDEVIISAFKALKAHFSNLKLLLVPRHPERFDNVYELCVANGLKTRRRSESVSSEFDILLGDTMGELMLLFGTSDIAFIGGSLVENGGHNYIEPAAWGLPMNSGPSTFNFRETAQELIEEGALVIADSDHTLTAEIKRVLSNTEIQKSMGAKAKTVANRNRGALSRLIHIIDATE